MSFDDVDERWTDDAPECPFCGTRMRSNDDCRVCAAGDKLIAVPEPSGRVGAEDWCFRYPPLTEAEKAQIKEEVAGHDGLDLSEVRGQTPRPPVHDMRHTAPEGARKESESDDMRRNQAFPGKHLKAGDLGGVRVAVVVDHVEEEMVGSGADAEKKAVCHFRGKDKGLVLNQTNWNMLEMITGKDDSDFWAGAKAILFESTTQFGGKMVPCLRLDPMPLGTQTARTVSVPLAGRPAPLPPTLPPPSEPEPGDDYHVSDDDVPFSLVLPFLLGLVGFGNLIV